MAPPIDTGKFLDLLATLHDKEGQIVGRLRAAGIGETTIARRMKSSPQAIAKRFPMGGTVATRTTSAGVGRPRRVPAATARAGRTRTTAKRTTTPRARGKVGARAR